MFTTRKRNPPNPERQLVPMQLEINTTHDYLPSIGEDWSKRWCTVTNTFEDDYEEIFNFELRIDDVFLVTFVKCGTTWMQEALWLLMNNLDYAKAKDLRLFERSVFLEFGSLDKRNPLNTIEMCNKSPSPRLIKSHLPANLLPKQLWKQKSKIVCVARNLKDVVVSYYHFAKGLGFWTGSIEEFVTDLMNNDIMYAPYWEHILDFWKMRQEPNICFITYEEMKNDLSGVVQTLCRFLERPELTAMELEKIVDHLTFENMKNNESVNETNLMKKMPITSKDFQFMRRGIVGSYKDELSLELQEKLNKWSIEVLSKHGISETDIFGNI